MPDICCDFLKQNLISTIKEIPIYVYDEIDSTNDKAKELVKNEGQDYALLIAERQTNGHGTKGRSFFSPKSGAYFTFVFPIDNINVLNTLTPIAALAVSKACEEITEKEVSIKWVNDIYINGKKACGILAETVINPATGNRTAIIGIGANMYMPEGGFPEELSDIATYICSAPSKYDKEVFISSCLNNFAKLINYTDLHFIYEEYKKRLVVLDRQILVLKKEEIKKAMAIDLNTDFQLLVKYEDGKEEFLSCDEISLKIL